jgi:hypothetical protein
MSSLAGAPSSVYVACLLASLHAAANIFTIACVPALADAPYAKPSSVLLSLFVSLSLLESLVHTVAGLPALAVGIPVDCGVPTIAVKHIKLSDYGCRTDNIFSSEYHNLEYI